MTPRKWDAELERVGLTRSRGRHRGTIRGVRVDACSGIIAAARLTAAIDPPLDLGIEATGHSERHRWSNAPFNYVQSADEDTRAGALLTAELRSAMVNLALEDDAAWTVHLTDRAFSIETPLDLRPALVANRASAAANVVEAVERARPQVPPAFLLAPAWESLQPVASAQGLQISPTPLGIAGRIRGLEARMHATRLGWRAYGLAARVRFAEPLGVPAVHSLYDGEVRRHLKVLSRHGLAVRCDDETVRATAANFPASQDDLFARLDELVVLAETLVHNAALARRGSMAPYR